MDIKKKIEELRKKIRYYEYKYYIEDNPEISDTEFDGLMKKLIELEKKYPDFITPDSPSQRVGGEPSVGKFPVIEHQVPMLSLENVYSIEELKEFDKRVRKNLESSDIKYSVELKIDGVAVSLTYENAVFVKAVTRGDGLRGDDITSNLKTIKSVPLRLKMSDKEFNKKFGSSLEIRGEVFLPIEKFNKLNENREMQGEVVFANPRNAASGSLKLLDSKQVAERNLDIFIHTIGWTDKKPWTSHYQALIDLKTNGLKISPLLKICKNLDEVIEICNEWETKREKLSFETDGMVIKIDSFIEQEKLGTTTKNPKYAVAYKFQPKQATTKLIDIEFGVGRTGTITPVAILEPVELAGSTISRCTLHNEDEVRRKGIKIGDTVLIEKGGDVIPKVVKVIEEKRTGKEKEFAMPLICPSCNEELKKLENEVAVRCINAGCAAQLTRSIEHFTMRTAMNINGFGPAVIKQLVEKKIVSNVADLYYLKKENLIDLERIGDKSAQNLLDAIEQSKNRDLSDLIFALGIRHVGVHVAEILSKHYSNIDELFSAIKEEIEKIAGIGPIVADSIYKFFSLKKNKEIIEKLKKAGVNTNRKGDRHIFRKNEPVPFSCVFTGELSKLTRSEAEKRVKELGGRISSTVSKKIDYVVVGENPGLKFEKAKKLGIKILNESDFLTLLNKFS